MESLSLSMNAATWMCVIFVLGYAAIVMEHFLRINKAAIALLCASILWTIYFQATEYSLKTNIAVLAEQMSSISEIVFFLLGAMTIVELIDSHNGFALLSRLGAGMSKKHVALILSVFTFFMSSVLDNLTTTLVMVALLKRIIADRQERMLLGGLIVISANAGGAWTPIGDVTTTMLWIKGYITTGKIIPALFLPSLVAMFTAIFWQTWNWKGQFEAPEIEDDDSCMPLGGRRVFLLGVLTFLFVPLFKSITHLPAYMGILLGLSLLWVVTDFLHFRAERHRLLVTHALTRIDSSSLLFFLGILLSIGALEHAKVLNLLAFYLDQWIGNVNIIAGLIGVLSAVIDNVPLVAASMSMYDLSMYPVDDSFWHLLAYCAGTGGSIFIIGSAAGIALMGMENVSFFWYLRKLSVTAFVSYLAGLFVYLLFV